MSCVALSCLLITWSERAAATYETRFTHCLGAGSRYEHVMFLSVQFLQGLFSSHFALSCRQLSHAFNFVSEGSTMA